MAWKHKNRWFRRWLLTITFWAVPVMIVAVNEAREEMAYNKVDLQKSLATWELTNAQRATGAAARCHGDPDEARAAGCPADILLANALAKGGKCVVEPTTGYIYHIRTGSISRVLELHHVG